MEHLGSIRIPPETTEHAVAAGRSILQRNLVQHLNFTRDKDTLLGWLQDLEHPFHSDSLEYFNSAALLRAEPVELHEDAGSDFTHGLMVMLSVPEGAVLKQTSGPDISLKIGDVIHIRYRHLHALEFPGDGLLHFLAIDFSREKTGTRDFWRSAIQPYQ